MAQPDKHSLSDLIRKLDEQLRQDPGSPALPNVVREHWLRQITAGAGKKLLEVTVKQSLANLVDGAPSKEQLTRQYLLLQNARVPVLPGFIKVLDDIKLDPQGCEAFSTSQTGKQPTAVTSSSAHQSQGLLTPVAGSSSGRTSAAGNDPVTASAKTNGSATPDAPQAPGGSAYLTNNPVYGQDIHSPLLRSKEYTPSLHANMAQRLRDAEEARAQLPNSGDLLVTDGRQKWLSSTHLPRVPQWNATRPNLTKTQIILDAQQPPSISARSGADIVTLPAAAQEAVVMNDLLYCFKGVEGKHIRARCAQGTTGLQLNFYVASPLDPCMLELTERMLPLCEYVVVIQQFIETRSSYKFGLVSQAVAAAMHSLLSDWMLMVGQLEHQLLRGRLTLQALLFYCQQPMATLRLLGGIAADTAARVLSPAGLLNLLHTKWTSLVGDRSAREVVQKLLVAATTPYFGMLQRWLCEGVLDDPYGEFMVQEDKTINKEALTDDHSAAYWTHRYTIRRLPRPPVDMMPLSPGPATSLGSPSSWNRRQEDRDLQDIPAFLQPCTDMILTTGKYLNTMRECGQAVPAPLPPGTSLRFDSGGQYQQLIERCHASASSALLEFFRGTLGLLGWLRSVKHAFLLDRGDLMVHLLEGAKEELSQRADAISRTRLKSLLELAVRMSSLAAEPHCENLGFSMDPRSLLELVKDAYPSGVVVTASEIKEAQNKNRKEADRQGWDLFLVSYRTAWPLTLVVSPGAHTKYQLVFKHLFMLKTQRAKMKASHALCSKLMFFVQEYLRYITFDILEPLWHGLEADIRKAANLDQVIRAHREFLSKVLDGMLLSRPKMLKYVIHLEHLAQRFAGITAQQFAGGSELDDVRVQSEDGSAVTASEVRAERQRAQREWLLLVASAEEFHVEVDKLSKEFADKLKDLVEVFQRHHAELMHREAGTSATASETASSRDELASLASLIQRIDLNKPNNYLIASYE